MKLKGAEIVVKCLMEQEVVTVFGFPGGTILNVYDALYNHRDEITHILTAHEQGASHAADGYARATGKTGVCFATSGPGATNLTTGIATAYMDSSPVVFITCNVSDNLLGRDSFQEVDITGITMPITKNNYMVRNVENLADVMREAFALAESGRPGPVLIDIMKDVTAAEAEYEFLPKSEHKKHGHLADLVKRGGKGITAGIPGEKQIDEIIRLIEKSERPMILCGGGVISSGASRELKELAERMDAPVASTLMGLGGIPGDHRLFTGMLGMHGSRASNIGCNRSDLFIAVGARFNDRVAGSPSRFCDNKTVVHIDIDKSEIDKNVLTDYYITGDAKAVLSMILSKLQKQNHEEWISFITGHRAPAGETMNGGEGISPTGIIRAIEEIAPENVIITTDVGQHQMWAAQAFQYKFPRQFISSGGFGTMGFGLGAAIGAKIGAKENPVVHIAGDGCFRMNCHELCTVEHYGVPVISVVFNNGTLGMVRQWQTLLYGGRYSQTTLDRGPDFVKLAEAYGVAGYRARTLDEFETAFKEAVESGKAAVIDCILDMDEKVRPMVPSGKGITEFLLD